MVECQLPKLKVASSSLVARSIFLGNSQTQFSKVRETLEPSRKRPANAFDSWLGDYQSPGQVPSKFKIAMTKDSIDRSSTLQYDSCALFLITSPDPLRVSGKLAS